MSWHYQIVDKDGWYSIREVYSDIGDDKGEAWTEDAVAPTGTSREDVIKELEMMLEDAKRWPTKAIDDET